MPGFIGTVISYFISLSPQAVFAINALSTAALVGYGQAEAQRQRRIAAARARAAYESSFRDRQVVVRSAEAASSIVYGRARVSGPLVDCFTSGSDKRFLHLIIALTAHEIDAIEDVLFNDQSIGTLDGSGFVTSGRYFRSDVRTEVQDATASFGSTITLAGTVVGVDSVVDITNAVNYTVSGNTITLTSQPNESFVRITYRRDYSRALVRVKRYLGTDTQVADPDAVAESGGYYGADRRGRGIAYLYVRLEYDQDAFAGGIPNISAIVRGKRVFDPRTSTTVWSRNAALIARDFLTSAEGYGCTGSEIDDTMVIAAANVCDETVPTDGLGATQTRYTCDAVFSTEGEPRDSLDAILSALAGTRCYVQGRWELRAGAYDTPTVTLTERDLAQGEITIAPRVTRRELYNAVRGRFIDPANNWQPVDFPPYFSSTFETQDGGERIVQDVTLPATTDALRAQRIAKLMLFRDRQALVFTATFNLRAFALSPGDTVMLTLARYGWTAKVFRVLERELDSRGTIRLTLREESAAIYAWDFSEATNPDPAPNTQLPTPWAVPALSGLTLTQGAAVSRFTADGTEVVRLRVSWTQHPDAAVLTQGWIDVEFKRAQDTAWQIGGPVNGRAVEWFLDPATPGDIINVRVRAYNGASYSAWSTATITMTYREPPPLVPDTFTLGTQPDGTRVLQWAWNAGRPVNVKGVRLRLRSGTGWAWDDMQPFDTDGGFVAQSPFETNQILGGTWTIGLRAESTSGQLSTATRIITATLPDPRLGNVLDAIYSAADGWPGTKTGCAVVGTALESVDSTTTWATLPATWDAWTRWVVSPTSPIVYTVPTIDIGAVLFVRPTFALDADGSTLVEVRTSNDNVTYSAWTSTFASGVTARYIQMRATVTATGPAPVPVIRQFDVFIGATLIVDRGEDVSPAALTGPRRIGVGDIRLPISNTYVRIVRVGVVIQSASGSITWTLVDKGTTNGPRVQFYNAAGSLVDPALIDYTVEGY